MTKPDSAIFVAESLGCYEFPDGSIGLVSGCDKSTSWGIMTQNFESYQEFLTTFTAIRFTKVDEDYT